MTNSTTNPSAYQHSLDRLQAMLQSNQEERTRQIGKLIAAKNGTDPNGDPEMIQMQV